MNERVLTPIIESGDFSSQVSLVQKLTEESGPPVVVEGLRGSSRALFLAKLVKIRKNKIPAVFFPRLGTSSVRTAFPFKRDIWRKAGYS